MCQSVLVMTVLFFLDTKSQKWKLNAFLVHPKDVFGFQASQSFPKQFCSTKLKSDTKKKLILFFVTTQKWTILFSCYQNQKGDQIPVNILVNLQSINFETVLALTVFFFWTPKGKTTYFHPFVFLIFCINFNRKDYLYIFYYSLNNTCGFCDENF